MTHPRSPVRVCTFLAVAAAFVVSAGVASADLEADLANGDRVTGTISPRTEVESFRFDLPAGSRLSVSARPKSVRARPFPPAVSLELRDPDRRYMADVAEQRGRSASIKGLEITRTGTYTLELRGDGFDVGDYRLSVKWKPIRKWKFKELSLADGGADIPFSGDRDALLRFDFRAAKKSAAEPWATQILDDEQNVLFQFEAPTGPRHKLKETRLIRTGDFVLRVVDRQGNGAARGVLQLKPPRSGRRSVGLTVNDLGVVPDDIDVVATLLADAGGAQGSGEGSRDPDADRIALAVDEGVFKKLVALQIGFAPAMISPPQTGLLPAGRTIYAGPDGVVFPQTLTLTIPFDVEAFPTGTAALRVVRRDPSGSYLTLPAGNIQVDGAAGTLTFPAGRTGTYAAHRLVPAPQPDSVFPFRGNDDGGYEISIFGSQLRDFNLSDGKHVLALTINGVATEAAVQRVDPVFVTFVAPASQAGFVTFGVLDRETGLLSELPVNSFEYF